MSKRVLSSREAKVHDSILSSNQGKRKLVIEEAKLLPREDLYIELETNSGIVLQRIRKFYKDKYNEGTYIIHVGNERIRIDKNQFVFIVLPSINIDRRSRNEYYDDE